MNPSTAFFNGHGDYREALVVVFLRGGADGLSLVAPFGDDDYHRARPRLALGQDDDCRLDDRFVFNSQLKELLPAFREGDLALIHGTGSEDQTRSHFEAQDLMEQGGHLAGGWLGRFLRYKDRPANGPLSAVALGRSLPESLRGAPAVTVMESLDEFSQPDRDESFLSHLEGLYSRNAEPLSQVGGDTLRALKRIEALKGTLRSRVGQDDYPQDSFGQGLRQIAQLIKARVGLEAATIDLGGWDSHLTQETVMTPLMKRLSQGLAQFRKDLGEDYRSTTIVAMTEFGRRLRENSAFGTDHGRGSVAFVLGGQVQGGRVFARWKGLSEDLLEGPGDLPVTIDYRSFLSPILARLGGGQALGTIFPEHRAEAVDVYS